MLRLIYSFEDKLAFSKGRREVTALDTIMAMIPGCIEVQVTEKEQDLKGIDLVATLRRGAKLNIDRKDRDAGAARWWANGPELALEKWSVKPEGRYKIPWTRAKAGWTLSERNETDLIFFQFDPSETDECFLVSFQLLRMAFIRFIDEWYAKYKVGIEDSGWWESECVFVPAMVTLDAMKQVSQGKMLL